MEVATLLKKSERFFFQSAVTKSKAKEQLYLHDFPLFENGILFGWVQVVLNKKNSNWPEKNFWHFFIPLLPFFLTFNLLMTFFSELKIFRPIAWLACSAHRMSQNNIYQPAEKRPLNKELEKLYQAFEDLNDSINKRVVEREMIESRLQLFQNFLSTLIDHFPAFVIVIDRNEQITLCNRFVEKVSRKNKEQLIATSLWGSFPQLLTFSRYIFQARENQEEVTLFRQSIEFAGRNYFFNLYFLPIFPENRKDEFFSVEIERYGDILIYGEEITLLVQKEEELVQIQKMDTVGTLASGLAHDLNNILSTIMAAVSLIRFKLEKNGEGAISRIQKNLDSINQSSKRAADIIKRLLFFSRRQELQLKLVDLNKILENALQIAESSFEKSIQIEFQRYNGNAFLTGDLTQLEQMLLNILVNARHAMTLMRPADQEWGGRLTINLNLLAEDFECSQFPGKLPANKYWQLKISDTGVGMPPEVKKKIFEPFFSTKNDSGTGLGMAMVLHIVQKHQGFIRVESEEGKGSSFFIYLPRVETGVAISDEVEEFQTKIKNSAGILIVDDDQLIRQVIEETLGALGFLVLSASDGQQAISVFKENLANIDVVLLDLIMPGMNGKELLIELKKICPKKKFILLSGYLGKIKQEDIFAIGISAALQKPFTLKKLLTTINTTISANTSQEFD